MQGIPFMQVLEYRVPAGMHQLVEDPSLQHLHQLAAAGKRQEFQVPRKQSRFLSRVDPIDIFTLFRARDAFNRGIAVWREGARFARPRQSALYSQFGLALGLFVLCVHSLMNAINLAN